MRGVIHRRVSERKTYIIYFTELVEFRKIYYINP